MCNAFTLNVFIYIVIELVLPNVSAKLKAAKPSKSKACCAPSYHDQLQSVCKLQRLIHQMLQ